MNVPVLNGIPFPTDLIIKAKVNFKQFIAQTKEYIMGQVKSRSATSAPPAPPAVPASVKLSNKLALGAGCYWGTEKYVRKDFQKMFPNSIKDCAVGFMSPESKPRISRPTYEQVCSGASGHIEVLYVELNEPEKHFEELIRFFSNSMIQRPRIDRETTPAFNMRVGFFVKTLRKRQLRPRY